MALQWVGIALTAATLLITSIGTAVALRSLAAMKRAEARQLDRNDVTWDWAWTGPGRMRFFKEGRDPALDVSVTAAVDGETRTAEADRLDGNAGDEDFHLDFPQYRESLRREVLERRTAPLRGAMNPDQYPVWYRVSWRSPSGEWHVDENTSFTSLEDHE